MECDQVGCGDRQAGQRPAELSRRLPRRYPGRAGTSEERVEGRRVGLRRARTRPSRARGEVSYVRGWVKFRSCDKILTGLNTVRRGPDGRWAVVSQSART